MARGRSGTNRSAHNDQATSGAWWRLAVIMLAGALTYWNGLSGPFIGDDTSSIVENGRIRQLSQLSAVLSPERNSPAAGRPLVNLSFAINYAWGGLDPFGYHAINIALHLICALLVFGVVRRTLELPRVHARLGENSVSLAFAAALIWTVHPLNSEVVDYLTQRTESMMALCYLLTLYASVRAIRSQHGASWSTVAAVACTCGVASKESMVTAPVIVMLFDRAFVFDTVKQALRARWRFYLALAATWLVLAALMWSGPRARTVGFSTNVGSWTYLLNQTVIIAQYLRLAVWPRSLVHNYGWAQPVTLGDVAPYAIVIVVLLLLTIVALARRPMLGFLGAWFFITLAPTSSIVPIATEVGAERRMYLPLIGIILLAVIGTARLGRSRAAAPTAGIVMLGLVSVVLAAATIERNREYASGLTLARTVLDRWPTSAAHYLMGTELAAAGRPDEAMSHLHGAAREIPRAHYTLGYLLFVEGKLDEAIAEFDTFIMQDPLAIEVIPARAYMGQAFEKQRRWPQAIEQFRLLLRITPSDPSARSLLAHVLFSQESFVEAIAEYREYLAVRPNDWRALTNLGIALVATGRVDEGLVQFRRAVDANPSDIQLQQNLVRALLDHGEVEEAARYAQRALARAPDDPALQGLLVEILRRRGVQRVE